MNLDRINFTDDKTEQIRIGKQLFLNNPEIYNDEIKGVIRRQLIENFGSGGATDDVIFRSIYHYWVYGANPHDCFEHDFFSKSHEEKIKYITMRYRVLYANRLNRNVADISVFENKYKCYEKFKKYFKRECVLIKNESDYKTFERFAEKHEEFIVKPVDLGEADGVFVYRLTGNIDRDFHFLIKKCRETYFHYEYGHDQALILEELITTSPENPMSKIHPSSCNGVRITTVRDATGNISFFHPWLRTASSGNRITSAKYAGICAHINRDGIVDSEGAMADGKRVSCHPDSNIEFKGFQIPEWDKLSELAYEIQQVVPEAGYIGWDFAYGKAGWCLIEANPYGDFYTQVILRKGLKQEFESLIGINLGTHFWWEESENKNTYRK